MRTSAARSGQQAARADTLTPMTDTAYASLSPAGQAAVDAMRGMARARDEYERHERDRNDAIARMVEDEGLRPGDVSAALAPFANGLGGVSKSNVRLLMQLRGARSA